MAGDNSSIPEKDPLALDLPGSKSKVFSVTNKGRLVDDQNQEHPWYLFPEEDIDDVSIASDSNSDSSWIWGEEDEEAVDDVDVFDSIVEFKDKISKKCSVKDEVDGKKLSCTVCGKTYKKKGHFERHQLKHSNDSSISNHKCCHCNYEANSVGNLKKHMLTHSGERPFKCDICGKSFRQKVHLKDHVRSHTGARDFQCSLCGATFVQKSSLRLHEKKHSGVRPYSCEICSLAFFEKQHLINHIRRHTGEKPYQCETCGQTFTTYRTLRTHNMIHTGERPHTCEKCGVSFREKATLQKHRGVHINVGPFPCDDCGKEFTRLASLTLHKKIHSQVSSNVSIFCNTSVSNYGVLKSETVNTTHIGDNQNQTIVQESVEDSVHNDEGAILSQIHDEDVNSFKLHTTSTLASSEQEPLKVLVNVMDGHNFNSSGLKRNVESTERTEKSFVNVKTPEKVEPILENIPHPDQVRQALECGTVLETKDADGNDFIVVLPAVLSNREIILASQNSDAILPLPSVKPMTFKNEPIGCLFKEEGHIEYIGKEVIKNGFSSSGEVIGKFKEEETSAVARITSLTLGEEDHSSNEANLDIEIFSSSSVEDDLLVTKTGGQLHSGRIIQEDIHSETTGLLLTDEDMEQVTEVTYVIEEGRKEPVSVFHNTTGNSDVKVIPFKPRRKKTGLAGDHELYVGNSNPKKRKREILSPDERKKIPRKLKEKKLKTKRIFECSQCGKTCKSSSNFISHLRTHSGERPYFCDVCGCGFKQIAHLRAHVRIHTGEKPFVCDLCGAAFTQSSRLNSHKKSLHVEGKKVRKKPLIESKIRNFFCNICNKTFLDECFKREHMEAHKHSSEIDMKFDKEQVDFQCDICGVVYCNRVTFNKHRSQHSDNKLTCEICGSSFKDVSSFQSHNFSVHGMAMGTEDNVANVYINVKIGKEQDFFVVNPSMKTKCTSRRKKRVNKAAAKVNFSNISDEDHKTPVIHVTETSDGLVKSEVMQGLESCDEETDPLRVVQVSQGIKDEPVTTEIDGNSIEDPEFGEIYDKSSFDDGENNAHFETKDSGIGSTASPVKKSRLKFDYTNSEGKKIWKCKDCNKEFFQSSNLHCHMRSHTGEKPYKCNICPKAFKQITHLKEHMHKHTGLKSFGCTVCGAHFTQRGAVKRHINVIHDGEGDIEKVKSFAAKRVKSTGSANGSSFVRRRTRKVKVSTIPAAQKIESCGLCGKKYHSGYMKMHMRCHTGEKPYKCDSCDKAFRQKSHLKSHLLRHNDIKPFICSLCGTSYMQLSRLKKHKDVCDGKSKPNTKRQKSKLLFKESEVETKQEADLTVIEEGYTDDEKMDSDCEFNPENSENDILLSSMRKKRLYVCDKCKASFTSEEKLELHTEYCYISSSDSEMSDDSADIPYEDESEEEITVLRKSRKKVSADIPYEDESEDEITQSIKSRKKVSADIPYENESEDEITFSRKSRKKVSADILYEDKSEDQIALSRKSRKKVSVDIPYEGKSEDEITLSNKSRKKVSADIPYEDKSEDEFTLSRKSRKKVIADILYADKSEDEITLSRKSRLKVMTRNKKELKVGTKDGSGKVENNELSGGGNETVDVFSNVDQGCFKNVCKICGAMFKRTSAWNFHMKMKHEINEKKSEGNLEISLPVPSEKPLRPKRKVVRKNIGNRTPIKEIDSKRRKKLLKESGQEYAVKNHGGSVPDSNDPFIDEIERDSESHFKNEDICDTKAPAKSVEIPCSTVSSEISCIEKSFSKLSSGEVNAEIYKRTGVRTSDISSSYVCSECGASFTRGSKLKNHILLWCKGKSVPDSASVEGSDEPVVAHRKKELFIP